MNWNHTPRKVLITGMSGSGKTTRAVRLLRDWKARNKFVFDPDREFCRKLKWPVAVAVNQLNAAAAKGVPVCFDPSEMFTSFAEGFDFFCRWTLSVSRCIDGKKVFVVDEVQKFTRVGMGGIPESLQQLLDVGRREEIDLVIISHAPKRVHDGIRGQLTEAVTFRHTDDLPISALVEMGFDGDRVRLLDCPGGYIYRNLLTGQTNEAKAHPSRKGSDRAHSVR